METFVKNFLDKLVRKAYRHELVASGICEHASSCSYASYVTTDSIRMNRCQDPLIIGDDGAKTKCWDAARQQNKLLPK